MEIQFSYESQDHHFLSDGEVQIKIGEPATEEEMTGEIETLTEESGSSQADDAHNSKGSGFFEFGDELNDQMLFGRRQYNCDECGQSFAWNTGLIRHQRTH